MSRFILGVRSKMNLRGVHPHLVDVVNRAIKLSDVDFTVTEGIRSLERQKQLVAAGASKTLNSRHLTGHAVDLAAVVGGKVRWDWELYLLKPPASIMSAGPLSCENPNTAVPWAVPPRVCSGIASPPVG